MSCAELKLVTVRVARPRHRNTVEEPGLRFRAEGRGPGKASGQQYRGKRTTEVAKLKFTTMVRGHRAQEPLGYRALGVNESQGTCLVEALPITSSPSPLGPSLLFT